MVSKIKPIFQFSFLFLFITISLFSETVVMRSGKSLEGKIVEQTSDIIIILDKKGVKRSISKRVVYKVLYNASEKEKLKVEENARALLEKEKAAKDAIAAEELRKLEEERLLELETVLEKNRIPVGESEETMMEYKRRIGELEAKVKDMEDFLGRRTDWRAYYATPRSEWDLVKRSAVLPGWGHHYAKEDSIGSAYTSLFFTSFALYLGSKAAVRNTKNELAADAVEITVIQPIFNSALVSLSPADTQAAVGNFLSVQTYEKMNKFQKDSSEYGQLKSASGNLEKITIALYLGQLVHSYFTGRTWAELNRQKTETEFQTTTFHLRTIQEPSNPVLYANQRPNRIEMDFSYHY
ncbi:hypothetical protein EHQ58_12245 [Leptospira ognonensis]|uniref:DUF5683 domain-containing protein n=1 Tax=Leptospira ognonensis TaxID=2484945 RepID=A0A4R9K204_9LEPT|nr:hypothetical protein [Leptospira ognonensis]TGL58145.1 hypothetical protein EHQ58_12245 [Leptospira ognonensis]